MDPFLADLLPVELVFHLVSGFEVGVEVLPHVADDPCYLGHTQVWVGFLYELVDIHSVEEECADCLFGGLGRNVVIVSI